MSRKCRHCTRKLGHLLSSKARGSVIVLCHTCRDQYYSTNNVTAEFTFLWLLGNYDVTYVSYIKIFFIRSLFLYSPYHYLEGIKDRLVGTVGLCI